MIEHLTQAAYLAGDRPLRPLAEVALAPDDGAARRAGRVRAAWRLAVVGTLLHPQIVSFHWIAIALVDRHRDRRAALPGAADRGAAADGALPRLRRPRRRSGRHREVLPVARRRASSPTFRTVAIVLEVLLGFLTCTGSLMAAGKLQEIIPTRPITYRGQNFVNLGAARRSPSAPASAWSSDPTQWPLFPVVVGLSLLFGVLLIIPIGGADMPTVISLLNSYAGLSAVAMGFVLENNLLIIAGALDGSSGLILSIIMCRAMNRSFTNVLFGAFGQVQATAGAAEQRTYRSATAAGRHADARAGEPRGRGAGLRHGGGAGAAPRPRPLRPAHEARRRRALRHPPGGRPHARSHERAARRGGHPLRPPDRGRGRQRRHGARPTSCWWSAPTTS